jgi:hypothetical protein
MASHPEERARAGLTAAQVAEWLHSDRGAPWRRAFGGGLAGYDAGGGIDPTQGGIGGMAPSVQTMNPLTRGMVQRYASLPTEKLQELSSMMGGSQQGQIIQSLLRQRQMMPHAVQQAGQQQQQTQQQPIQAAPQPQVQTQARGGGIVGRAYGGDMGIGMSASMADPWWTRQEAREELGSSGFLGGSTLGRADAIRTTAPGGAYVIPADVVAGLGEGNSLAGARILQEMMATGPYGTPLPRGGGARSLPHPVAPQEQARGGTTRRAVGAPVPVLLSHGEFVVAPDDVRRIGRGDLAYGHRLLDRFVQDQRARQIAKLKRLPGPVRSAA